MASGEWWATSPDHVAGFMAVFNDAADVVTDDVSHAPHNVSVDRAADDYHEMLFSVAAH